MSSGAGNKTLLAWSGERGAGGGWVPPPPRGGGIVLLPKKNPAHQSLGPERIAAATVEEETTSGDKLEIWTS